MAEAEFHCRSNKSTILCALCLGVYAKQNPKLQYVLEVLTPDLLAQYRSGQNEEPASAMKGISLRYLYLRIDYITSQIEEHVAKRLE